MSYPGSDLLFRLAVASSGLQCVTDAEDTQLAKGQGGGEVSKDIKQTCCVCVCVCLPSIRMNPVLAYIHSLFGSLSEAVSSHISAGS